MHKKLGSICILLIIFLLIMACTISYEGVIFSDDDDHPDRDIFEMWTLDAMGTQSVSEPAAATPKPEYQPAEPQGSDLETANAGTHEYSVQAANFECTCQVDGNQTVRFSFMGDQVEVTNDGGAAQVYDKIGENTYKRTFMGYYILDSGSGDQVTSTIVEEEKHVMIIFTSGGYRMEHYSGSSSSPCCYHTFSQVK
jgi:hypothetical protein